MTSTSLRSSSSTRIVWTGRGEGDLGLGGGTGVDERRRAVWPGPWSWLTQVHGAAVHVVARPGAVQGAPGDGLVTSVPGAALAVFTADCAPVALTSPEGVIGVAHAGWRGLEAGVIGATVAAMRALGASRVEAALGPCIRSECYEFGEQDLERLAVELGDAVRSLSRTGRPALDLPAAVEAALARAGAELTADHGACTACSDAWFSHRARRDTGRQATLVVVEA